MKCSNCGKEIPNDSKYCIHCGHSYINLNSALNTEKKEEKKRSIVGLVLTVLILIVLLFAFVFNKKTEKKSTNIFDTEPEGKKEDKNRLDDMITSVCNGEYDVVYSPQGFDNKGIYQCKKNTYVYYIVNEDSKCGYYECGKLYEIGYTYNEDIEKIFRDSVYLYRESKVTGIPSELKIVVKAASTDELVNLYADKLYSFINRLNKDYNKDINIDIYYNSSISSIKKTYDKLFLMSHFSSNNVTIPRGMGKEYGSYTFYDADITYDLSLILQDINSFSNDARKAMYNRGIYLSITDGKTITEEEFLEKLKKAINEKD